MELVHGRCAFAGLFAGIARSPLGIGHARNFSVCESFGRTHKKTAVLRRSVTMKNTKSRQDRNNTKPVSAILKDARYVYTKYKPWWCQPWSILSTGALITLTSCTVFHDGLTIFITAAVGAAIALWWYVFLIVYPQQVVDEEDERTRPN